MVGWDPSRPQICLEKLYLELHAITHNIIQSIAYREPSTDYILTSWSDNEESFITLFEILVCPSIIQFLCERKNDVRTSGFRVSKVQVFLTLNLAQLIH